MWETLDIAALLALRDAQHEDTTSANVGAYPIPLGGMLRRDYPYGSGGHAPYKECPPGKLCALDDWTLSAWADDPLARRM